jgi:hypothetical protein
MKAHYRLTWIAVAIVLGTCSMGTKVDPTSFQPGVTTYAAVVQRYGQPQAQKYLPDGGRKVRFSYVHATPFGGRSDFIDLEFGRDGVLTRVAAEGHVN